MIFGNRLPCGRQWPLLFPAPAVPCGVWAAMTLPKAREHAGPGHPHLGCTQYVVFAGGDAAEVRLIPLSGAFKC